MSLESVLGERGFSLERIDSRLSLRDLEDEQMSPLVVDFTSSSLLHRIKHGVSKNQPIGKALGLKSLDPHRAPFIFDATAGIGTDTFVMAALGCRVRSVERSEALFLLLEDGKTRLDESVLENNDDEGLSTLASRFSFEHGDAKDILSTIEEHDRPDVIYLDPMYPDDGRHRSALPKKTMQMFRRLLDGDDDADELFEIALGVARIRVIVKRPLKALSLGNKKPAHSFEGKTARLDLYLTDF